ncbi:MAG: recombination mediator RecR [Candidatus Saccharimonadales bacterium]|nr:recombination mediator RecR [Candidatus Saccharimonadales bacterium]
MSILPKSLRKLIDELSALPGVGERTAERYAFHILRSDPRRALKLAESLGQVHEKVAYCPVTFALMDSQYEVSPLYSDPSRDKTVIAVVENPLDVIALEKTGQFKGTYHVLGGALSPIDGVGPEQLRIQELLQRIADDNVTEVIIATNASVEGESTALFVHNQLDAKELKITRLARGLPAGVDLEYADQITLTRALEGRQSL